jgi:hypothetical protein
MPRLVRRGPKGEAPHLARLANPLSLTHNSRVLFRILRGDIWGMSSFGNVAVGATLALALSLSMLPTTGHAYTPEEEQACTPDAMRICGAYIPDVDRITACMIQNKSQLSPECRRFFRDGPEPGEAAAIQADRPGKPVNIKPTTTQKSKAKARKTAKPDAT